MGVNTTVITLAGGLIVGIILFIIWYNNRNGKKAVRRKIMKHLKNINESFGNGEEEFEATLDSADIHVSGMPEAWSDRDLSIGAKLKWRLTLNLNKSGIEWFATSVRQIIFFGHFEDDEEMEFEIQEAETELYDITKSFYAHSIELDMKDSNDVGDWEVKVYFGNPI